jgi:hypothetical protein
VTAAVLGPRQEGKYGWAQQISVPDHFTAPTAVANWFMNLPNQSPVWENYLLSVVSLEPTDYAPFPQLQYPGAQYELAVLALAPDFHPVVDNPESWQPMMPANFVAQFHGVTREQAATVGASMARGCVHGMLLAETQVYVTPADGSEPKMMYIAQVLQVWKQALAQTVEHEQTGGLHSRVN